MLFFRLELEFPCPRTTCEKARSCCQKIKIIIFKQYESEEHYDWFPIANFCDEKPTRAEVINFLIGHFSAQLKEKSLYEEE